MTLSSDESRLVTSPVIFYVRSPKNGVHHLMWMRRTIGIVLPALGGVWIAQGSGALHGSFMTGEALWTVIGVIVALFGIALLIGAARDSKRAARDEG